MKEAEEAAGLLSSAALDLDEAVVGVLDLPDDRLRVGIGRPGDHRHGRLNQEHVFVEVSDAVGEELVVAQGWKKGTLENRCPVFKQKSFSGLRLNTEIYFLAIRCDHLDVACDRRLVLSRYSFGSF